LHNVEGGKKQLSDAWNTASSNRKLFIKVKKFFFLIFVA